VWIIYKDDFYSTFFITIMILGLFSILTGIVRATNCDSRKERENTKGENELRPLLTRNREVLSALLDLFSDSALGYISAFVACIFGLFATLTLILNENVMKTHMGFWFLSVVYWLLFLGGVYSFLNFTHFTGISHKIKMEIISSTDYHQQNRKRKGLTTFESQQEAEARQSNNIMTRCIWNRFYNIKYRRVFPTAFIVFFIVVFVPWIFSLIEKYAPWILV